MKQWFREKIARWLTTIFIVESHERIVGAVYFRGYVYIVTDCRLLRYDPDRDIVSARAPID